MVLAAKQKAGENTRTESEAWPRSSYSKQIRGQRWVGPQHDIQVDTLVLGQPTS